MRILLWRTVLTGILALALILAACSGGTETQTDNTTTTATPSTTTTPPSTTTTPPDNATQPPSTFAPEDLLPPSPEQLAAQGFTLPELPRITCERLKQMMDNGEPFLLVDTRISFLFNLGNLPQSINAPNDLPESDFIDRLMILPRDRPVILYCD